MAEGIENTKLSPGQIKVLEVLLGGGTRVQAAHAAGVTRQTVYLWLDAEPLKSEYEQAVQAAYEQAVRLRRAAISCAIENLMSIASDETKLAKYRVEAAAKLLEYSLKLDTGRGEEDEPSGALIYLPAKGSVTVTHSAEEPDPEGIYE